MLYPTELQAHDAHDIHHLLIAKMERVMGIEPTRPAWKAGILPLNYTRSSSALIYSTKVSKISQSFLRDFLTFFQKKYKILFRYVAEMFRARIQDIVPYLVEFPFVF